MSGTLIDARARLKERAERNVAQRSAAHRDIQTRAAAMVTGGAGAAATAPATAPAPMQTAGLFSDWKTWAMIGAGLLIIMLMSARNR